MYFGSLSYAGYAIGIRKAKAVESMDGIVIENHG